MVSISDAKKKAALKPKYGRGAKRRDRADVYRHGELATAERTRQGGGVVIEQEPESPNSRVMIRRARARCECKLDALLLAGKIEQDEHKAGMHYRAAWLCLVEGVKTRDPLERQGAAAFMSDEEKKRGAEKVLHEAHKEAKLTVTQVMLVTQICGADEGVGPGGVRALRRALDKLSRFWGFA
ncbi:MAG: hypothetical protein KGI37_07675 [Alphaproteobacteria bacterium]|nr:hypothetical protein [Alphaproteobacteria bacterium]